MKKLRVFNVIRTRMHGKVIQGEPELNNNHYILNGKKPVKCDLHTWAKWFESSNRHVRSTKFFGIHVSTVFLGLNHNYGPGDPLLFETMIFGGKMDQEYQDRYATWNRAVWGHRKALLFVIDFHLRITHTLKQFKSWVK